MPDDLQKASNSGVEDFPELAEDIAETLEDISNFGEEENTEDIPLQPQENPENPLAPLPPFEAGE